MILTDGYEVYSFLAHLFGLFSLNRSFSSSDREG